MANSQAAERYAESLISLATEGGHQDVVFADMQNLEQMLKGTPELGRVLGSPIVSSEKKLEILKALFKGGSAEITVRFLEQIAKHDRSSLLPGIATQFVTKYLNSKGTTRGEVVSAIPLGEAELKEVSALAKKLTGMDVQLEQRVDARLIGGFVLRVGDKQIDQSVAAKLDRMRRQLVSQ